MVSRRLAGPGVVLLFAIAELARAATISPPVQVGAFTDTTLREVSGIVESPSLADTLWVHNDSGDVARFFAVNSGGDLLGTFPLAGATADDWEDLAVGPRPGGGNYLYLGDIGDNDAERSEIAVFRVEEPQSTTSATIAAADYTQVQLQYPDGARNAESLMVDPLSGDLYIVTKSAVGRVYRAAAAVFDNPAQVSTLELLGNLTAPLFEPSAADISPDGSQILIRDRSTTAYLFDRAPGQSVWEAIQGPGMAITLADERQGEAIGWAADGSGFFSTSEWRTSGPIYYYRVVPEPTGMSLALCGVLALAGSFAIGRRRAGGRRA